MKNIAFLRETSGGTEKIDLEHELYTERRLFITDVIDAETATDFVKKLMYLEQSDEPIDIYINCTGGEVTAGLLMYDVIQGCKNEINMYCIGQACSMAAVLLAAGQKSRRFILPHSRVMIHEVLVSGGIGGSATSIAKISDSIMETRDLVNSLLAKHTGKSVKTIDKATSFDNFMNAEQAIEFGICDSIVENFNTECA